MEDYRKKSMSVGPWGGQGGIRWDDGVHSGVRQLMISHGSGIDSIRIEYDDHGISMLSDKHGGSGGNKTDKVRLDPDEYLTSVHGHYGSINQWGPVFVKSLTFKSNKKTYGPYGIEHGTYFSCPMNGGKIVGFHGKGDWYLDAIGAYVEPLTQKTNASKALVQLQPHNLANGAEKFGYSVVQGSLGDNYDVVVAFRQKNEHNTHAPKILSNEHKTHSPKILSRQSSSSSDYSSSSSDSDSDTKRKGRGSAGGVPAKLSKGVVTYGAWGGSGGTAFDDAVYTGVREIHVSRNVGIVSIRVFYDQNGESIWGCKNGGTGGFKTEKIILDYPYEILTHISGCYGPAMKMGPNIIKSLTFHTTKTKYGPFGEEHGQAFTTNLKEGKIVGFHGRKGLFLDAIGVHVVEGKVTPPVRPPTQLNSSTQIAAVQTKTKQLRRFPFKSSDQSELVEGKVTQPKASPVQNSNQGALVEVKVTPPIRPLSDSSKQGEAPNSEAEKGYWSNKLGLARRGPTDTEVTYKVVKEPALCETGPWGGEGGRPWDDGVFSGIKQILLSKKEAICSIQFEYDRNGQSVWSVKHGGDGGVALLPLKLDHPHEVITCISGYYGPINGDHGPKVIKSLTITTTRRKFGPYGEEMGVFFSACKTEGKVVGFHGRSGLYLDAIGVHMQHWLGNEKQSRGSSIMKYFN